GIRDDLVTGVQTCALPILPNNNGRVGVFGISYPGWLTAVAGIGAHPALRALSPQAPMGDAWMGDDFFHQGAFRVSYGLEYSWMKIGRASCRERVAGLECRR